MQILVVGGTGTAGRVLAARAVDAGHRVRVLTRQASHPPSDSGVATVVGDVLDGRGLDAAVEGVDAVVDLSNPSTVRRRAATTFFTTATRRLLAAEAAARVGHHLTLSIVGVDRFPSGYYRAKLAQEAAALAGGRETGVGVTIARVTQFHELTATVADRFRVGRVVLAPPLRERPVHLADVADHVLRLVAAGPAGYAEELGGPREEELPDLVRRYLAATGVPARVVPLPLPGALGRANRAEVLLPEAGVRGARSFEDWLREVSCSAQPHRV
jgi:uncharacterized protein YbjT (DUF2867 family)